jgi:hypothetical protein
MALPGRSARAAYRQLCGAFGRSRDVRFCTEVRSTLRWSERDSNRRSLLRRVRRARGKGRSLRGFSGIPSFSATTGPCGTQRAKPENRFAAATGRPERQRALAAALHPGEWGQNSHVSVVRHTPAYRMLRNSMSRRRSAGTPASSHSPGTYVATSWSPQRSPAIRRKPRRAKSLAEAAPQR